MKLNLISPANALIAPDAGNLMSRFFQPGGLTGFFSVVEITNLE